MTIEPYNYNDEPSGRTDTLIQALEKIERLEKQLFVAITAMGAAQDLLQAGFTRSPQEVIDKAFNEIKELEK